MFHNPTGGAMKRWLAVLGVLLAGALLLPQHAWSQPGAIVNNGLQLQGSPLSIQFGASPSPIGTLQPATPLTGNRTWTLPNASGTIITTGNASALNGLVAVNASLPLTGQGTATNPLALNYNTTTLSVSGGQLTANNGSAIWNANQLQGNPVASGTPTAGQVLLWDGSAWTATTLSGDIGSVSGTGAVQVSGLCGTPLNCTAIGGLTGTDRKVLTWNGTQWTPWGIVGDGTTTTVTAATGNFTVSANNNSAIWNADRLQGNPVATGTPTAGQVLLWNGSAWTATALSGDIGSVSGTGAVQVSGLCGTPLNCTAISALGSGDNGKVLMWDGTALKWTAAFLTPSGPAGGDLSGSYPNPTVVRIQGKAIDPGLSPAAGQVLTWDATNGWWTAAGIGASGGWAVGGNAFGGTNSIQVLGTTTNDHLQIQTGGANFINFNTNTNASGDTVEMRLLSNGQLVFFTGGSTPPSYRIDLPNNTNVAIGRVRANGFATYSSLRWKEDIRPIPNALEKALALRGVNFRWKPEYGGGEDIGFIMEEVDRVVPEVVDRDERTGELLGMDYSRLTALLVEALKQHVRTQEQVNARLQQENAELRQRVERLESLVEQLLRQNGERGTGSQPSTIQDAWLGQNIPNPFAGTTTIPYYIPAGVSRAELVVRDVGGRELKRLELAERGAHGQVVLEMGLLGSGTYEYALVLDGRVVAVKQMTLMR
jgi:hypothetical protein